MRKSIYGVGKSCVSATAVAIAAMHMPAYAMQEEPTETATASSGVVEGVVTDAAGGTPLRGASVRIVELDRTTSTGTDGRFRFDGIVPGNYTIEFSYLNSGLQQSTITVTDSAGADVSISLGGGDDGDAIVVFGTRGSLASARAQELASDQFKTIVSADAIGNFADQNVAESLQRLPGLSIRRSEGRGNRSQSAAYRAALCR